MVQQRLWYGPQYSSQTPKGKQLGLKAVSCSLQTIAVKALGTPHVFVEALDPDGNKVVEKVESEVSLQTPPPFPFGPFWLWQS